MTVLFVCSGNKSNGPGAVVKNQADSLRSTGINVEYFLIFRKGATGYLSRVLPLYRVLKKRKYHVIHAHYGDSAVVATLAGARPLVVSLMGTDALGGGLSSWLVKLLSPFWKTVIAKSNGIASIFKQGKCTVIPNGVDLSRFAERSRDSAREAVGWDKNRRYILFFADPSRVEKNFTLAITACAQLQVPDAELKVVFNVPHERAADYLYAANVVLMTSLHEGSPNVIKEAMACNRSIVSTRVGDVSMLLENLDGCYITDFNPIQVASAIEKALKFNQNTRGRERILRLGLDSETVAKRIVQLYNTII